MFVHKNPFPVQMFRIDSLSQLRGLFSRPRRRRGRVRSADRDGRGKPGLAAAQERAAAVAARKQEVDELAAQTTLAEIAARREADRRGEQRKEAVDAAQARKDAKLRRKAARVEEAVMDWPARLWAGAGRD